MDVFVFSGLISYGRVGINKISENELNVTFLENIKTESCLLKFYFSIQFYFAFQFQT